MVVIGLFKFSAYSILVNVPKENIPFRKYLLYFSQKTIQKMKNYESGRKMLITQFLKNGQKR